MRIDNRYTTLSCKGVRLCTFVNKNLKSGNHSWIEIEDTSIVWDNIDYFKGLDLLTFLEDFTEEEMEIFRQKELDRKKVFKRIKA